MADEAYRDDFLLVLDKAHGEDSQLLYEALKSEHAYLGLHHRLDQPASGLLLMTRDERVNAAISAGFREHRIERTYRAVLMGTLPGATTWTGDVDGKPATTHVRAISSKNGMTAVEVRLETGRKHQIRIHAAMAGLPICGDRRYGDAAGGAWPRLALHAARLELEHPRTGDALVLESQIPADLQQLWSLAGGS